jgi:hypothetical protein
MNIPKAPIAGPALRSASGRSYYKRTATVIATFALATVFTLAAAPAATASTNNLIPSASTAALLDDPWPGPVHCDQWGCWPGGVQEGHKQSDRRTSSASTGAASSGLASPPSHYGPLCPEFPGTCPPS